MKNAFVLLSCAHLALAGTLLAVGHPIRALAHEGHEHFSAGVPGDPKKPSRRVNVIMLDEGSQMLFQPSVVEVRLGEQIRFEIYNEGSWDHEFMLATKEDNQKHAEVMKKFPNMEHDDPNAIRLSPLSSGSLVWKFTKRGEFEFACLIPGHREHGMHGKVVVK